MVNDWPSVMTASEAASYLRISQTKLREMIRQGRLPAINDGVTRISRAAVDRLMGGNGKFYSQGEVDRLVEEARAAERARLIAKLVNDG